MLDGFLQTFTVADKATGVRRTPRAGEIFKNPALANTLTKLQQGGCQEFYNGSIAKAYEAYGAVSESLRVRVRLALCPPLRVCLCQRLRSRLVRLVASPLAPRGTGHRLTARATFVKPSTHPSTIA